MIRREKNVNLSHVRNLAAALARKSAAKKNIIGLVGSLGSGKTTFTKAFATTLKIKKITSPTFTIINSYHRKRLHFYHLDLYRLKKIAQLKALGFEEIASQPNIIMLIEWADKFPEVKKICNIIIKLEFSRHSHERDITIIEN